MGKKVSTFEENFQVLKTFFNDWRKFNIIFIFKEIFNFWRKHSNYNDFNFWKKKSNFWTNFPTYLKTLWTISNLIQYSIFRRKILFLNKIVQFNAISYLTKKSNLIQFQSNYSRYDFYWLFDRSNFNKIYNSTKIYHFTNIYENLKFNHYLLLYKICNFTISLNLQF